jgi:FLVCR family MFS transporter 7
MFAVPGVVAMILAIAGVTTSRPPTPPAPSAAQDSETFFNGLKQVLVISDQKRNSISLKTFLRQVSWKKFSFQALKSKQFWVLMVCFGTGIGMFSALTTLLEQIICVHSYSDVSIQRCFIPQ